MPTPLIKSLAKKTGKSVEAVEMHWESSKREAAKKFGPVGKLSAMMKGKYWAYVNSTTQRKLGMHKENASGGVSLDVPDNYQDGKYNKDGYLKHENEGQPTGITVVQRKKIDVPKLNIENNINVDGIPFAVNRHKIFSENEKDPCWEGYEMIGMKEKDGKKVPNCVPENKEESTEISKDENSGVYVGVRYTKTSQALMNKWLKDNNIPNPIDTKHMHTTVVYSKKPLSCTWELLDFTLPLRVINTTFSFDIFKNDGKNCLVLLISCPLLYKRWELARKLGASYDFEKYRPHITLSYDVGNLDVHSLALPTFSLYIDEEYCEPLDEKKESKSKKDKETSNFIEEGLFFNKPKTPMNLNEHPKYLAHKKASRMHSDMMETLKNHGAQKSRYFTHHLHKFGHHQLAMHKMEQKYGAPSGLGT